MLKKVENSTLTSEKWLLEFQRLETKYPKIFSIFKDVFSLDQVYGGSISRFFENAQKNGKLKIKRKTVEKILRKMERLNSQRELLQPINFQPTSLQEFEALTPLENESKIKEINEQWKLFGKVHKKWLEMNKVALGLRNAFEVQSKDPVVANREFEAIGVVKRNQKRTQKLVNSAASLPFSFERPKIEPKLVTFFKKLEQIQQQDSNLFAFAQEENSVKSLAMQPDQSQETLAIVDEILNLFEQLKQLEEEPKLGKTLLELGKMSHKEIIKEIEVLQKINPTLITGLEKYLKLQLMLLEMLKELQDLEPALIKLVKNENPSLTSSEDISQKILRWGTPLRTDDI